MDTEFPPSKRTGLIVLGVLCVFLAAGSGFLFLRAVQARIGIRFTMQVLAALLMLVLFFLLFYRTYAVYTMNYSLHRDGLMLRWGIRREDIPIRSIEWVRPAIDLGFHLPLPWLRLPGSLFGRRNVEGLGTVEFIATNSRKLVLVATQERVYAISPMNWRTFTSSYQHINELGSLEPIAAKSVYPSSLLATIWQDQIARTLILISLILMLSLFGLVALLMPGHESIYWLWEEIAPVERLYLLPILNALMWLIDMLVGTYLYVSARVAHLAVYILWASSCLTGLLLAVATIIMFV